MKEDRLEINCHFQTGDHDFYRTWLVSTLNAARDPDWFKEWAQQYLAQDFSAWADKCKQSVEAKP